MTPQTCTIPKRRRAVFRKKSLWGGKRVNSGELLARKQYMRRDWYDPEGRKEKKKGLFSLVFIRRKKPQGKEI